MTAPAIFEIAARYNPGRSAFILRQTHFLDLNYSK